MPAFATPAMPTALRGLYLLTPDEPDTARLLERVAEVLAHAVLLQYRNKRADRGLQRDQLTRLLPICQAAGVPLLVNDDWALAREIGAAGAHLGRDDGDLRNARSACGGDFILGASCYDSADLARAAAEGGASYLAFGAFHSSPTKPHAPRADPALLRLARQWQLPCVAIGGITPDNGAPLVAAGADMLAVISGVFDAPDPPSAAQAYRRCFDVAADPI